MLKSKLWNHDPAKIALNNEEPQQSLSVTITTEHLWADNALRNADNIDQKNVDFILKSNLTTFVDYSSYFTLFGIKSKSTRSLALNSTQTKILSFNPTPRCIILS